MQAIPSETLFEVSCDAGAIGTRQVVQAGAGKLGVELGSDKVIDREMENRGRRRSWRGNLARSESSTKVELDLVLPTACKDTAALSAPFIPFFAGRLGAQACTDSEPNIIVDRRRNRGQSTCH
jgi:hypothetical protein